MIVGLPGAGISALFYLLCVLLMPFHSLWTVAQQRSLRAGQLRLIVRQAAIAFGVLLVIGASGWALELLVNGTGRGVASGTAAPVAVLGGLGVLVAIATLGVVLSVVQLASLIVRARHRKHGRIAGPLGAPRPSRR